MQLDFRRQVVGVVTLDEIEEDFLDEYFYFPHS